jgi:hypothetical protein
LTTTPHFNTLSFFQSKIILRLSTKANELPQVNNAIDETLHDMGVCNPGDYACHPQDYSWLIVCDANGNWQIASYCGQNGKYGW